MTMDISVAVVDDHPLVRAGIIKTLSFDDQIKVVGEGATCEDALGLVRDAQPDIILLDISMPGGGLSATSQIAKLPRAPKIVILTVSEDDDTVLRAIEAGAVGYITKGVQSEELLIALRDIARGRSYISPTLSLRVLTNARTASIGESIVGRLTQKEQRTLLLVAKGFSNKEIADALHLRETTVKAQMTNIMKKISVRNRVEAASWAWQFLSEKI